MDVSRKLYALLAGVLAGTLAACQAEASASGAQRDDIRFVPGGDANRGRALLQTYGCHTCHTIPGVPEANALVGPPLTAWRDRQYIAGSLPNNGENLVLWLMEPQTIEPGTAMPDMAVTEQDARDMGAYLFTLERDDD